MTHELVRTPVVDTTGGPVRGAMYRGVQLYRGIPYGGPTEGARRFLPPQPPARWSEPLDVVENGPRSVQPAGVIFENPDIGQYFCGGRPEWREHSRQVDSENCLNLNVVTPGLDGARPVMVYIHGGGFMGGSAVLTAFADGLVSREDIVLVGLNHRLNVCGYLYLGGLDARYAQGNVGQLDLVLALEWVRDNIAAFGGDPHNVTIFGESGGGAKVSALMAMPAAAGLFQKAIVQSGSALQVGTAEQGTENAEKLLKALAIGTHELDRLLSVPTRAPLDALLAGGGAGAAMRLGPVIDGHSILEQTWTPNAPAISAAVPLMVGNCKDESTLFGGDQALFNLDQAGLRERLVAAGLPAGEVDGWLAAYHVAHPGESPTDLWFRIATDRGARRNAALQAERKIAQGTAPAYVYSFEWNTPCAVGRLRAWHTSDLPLTMGLTLYPESAMLSHQLGAAWAAFARTGDPSQPGLAWPAYSLERRTTMVFDLPGGEAQDDPDGALRAAMREHPSGGLL